MTAIFGWQDGSEIFLIGDSAVTRVGEPRGTYSSFGEATLREKFTIEEGAIKIIELPGNVVVGVSGDVEVAFDFLELFARELRTSHRPVRQILHEIGRVFRGRREVEMLVAHPQDGDVALTRVRNTDAIASPVGNAVAVLGSLPRAKRLAAQLVISQLRTHKLPPEAQLAAAIVHLQAGGILDYLFAHGVGGTLFGARLSSRGVVWQPDLMFLLYGPGAFGTAPVVRDETEPSGPATSPDLKLVRVLVRQGAGIVLSSLGLPPGRVFIPPGRGFTEARWQEIVVAAIPPPFELIVASTYYGFLSTTFRKATFYGTLDDSSSSSGVSVTGRPGRRHIRIVPRLVETLEGTVPAGYFDFAVVTEDRNGIDAIGYRLHEDRLQ